MQDSTIEITIDGQKVSCNPGESIIEVADKHGIYIPRFCYHEKLSVVANCRMCLVEVQGAPKALPACATPISKDMVVATQSSKAQSAQRAVMQFLLINHPLDCPICDQGGECDLQDIAMGYGEGVSKFTDKKRAVVDEDLGPLVSTEMTRCIHCTRCVRFGDEIAGIPELALTQRGGSSKISTYLESGLSSELSGNMIDVCPVGALTSKPYRFSGRSWGYSQHSGIAFHDCIGSNTYLHVDKTNSEGISKVMRVVPKSNDAVNEQWLSDVDRFSYQGMYENRLTTPLIKKSGRWYKSDWYSALDLVAKNLRKVMLEHGDNKLAVIASSQSSLEEAYMMQMVMRTEGAINIDYRYRQSDFSYDEFENSYPGLNISLEEIETLTSVLIIGGDIRRNQPMLNHRIRKAKLKGAEVSLLHAYDPGYNFEFDSKVIASVQDWEAILLEMICLAKPDNLSDELAEKIKLLKPRDVAKDLFESLNKENSMIILGLEALHSVNYSNIRYLSSVFASATSNKLGVLSDGANSAGLWLAGCVPHRGSFGSKLAKKGNADICSFKSPAKAYWLHQFDTFDSANTKLAKKHLLAAEFVVACQSYDCSETREYADVILPLALSAETSGIWINAEGRWQTSNAAAMPIGDSKPGWKIFRALADSLGQEDNCFNDLGKIRDEITRQHEKMHCEKTEKEFTFTPYVFSDSKPYVMNVWPANQQDQLVRNAKALQELPRHKSLVGSKDTAESLADNTLVVPLYKD